MRVVKVDSFQQSKKRPSSGRGVGFSDFVNKSANSDTLTETSDMQSDVSSNSPPLKYDRTDGRKLSLCLQIL